MPLIDPITMFGSSPSSASKSSQPIELLPAELARICKDVHPAVLLSAYYLRFSAFVADPVGILVNSLLPLASIQIAYAVTCLPATGSNTKPTKKKKIGAPSKTTEVSTAKAFVSI